MSRRRKTARRITPVDQKTIGRLREMGRVGMASMFKSQGEFDRICLDSLIRNLNHALEFLDGSGQRSAITAIQFAKQDAEKLIGRSREGYSVGTTPVPANPHVVAAAGY